MQQILLPAGVPVPVKFVAEYSDAEERTKITASYGGDKFDPAGSENEFSYTLLKQSLDEFKFNYNPEQEFSNTVEMHIAEGRI